MQWFLDSFSPASKALENNGLVPQSEVWFLTSASFDASRDRG